VRTGDLIVVVINARIRGHPHLPCS
jgi:hypothetical protein